MRNLLRYLKLGRSQKPTDGANDTDEAKAGFKSAEREREVLQMIAELHLKCDQLSQILAADRVKALQTKV